MFSGPPNGYSFNLCTKLLTEARLNPTWFSYVLARLQAGQAQQAGLFHGFWLSGLVLPALVTLLLWPLLRNQPVKVATYPPVPGGAPGR